MTRYLLQVQVLVAILGIARQDSSPDGPDVVHQLYPPFSILFFQYHSDGEAG